MCCTAAEHVFKGVLQWFYVRYIKCKMHTKNSISLKKKSFFKSVFKHEFKEAKEDILMFIPPKLWILHFP